ncbi:hypothetical protein [uncultured Aquimarina sp.]|uniref:hypothetical protein n=1 Tax=uncultured Aquimarina sp. TaxID=575652 RepID=UPI002607194B|nr:hypothetical protein [uncultured Aquimarina sp.]
MITKNSKIWKYISNLFVAIDQLGNAIAGGNPDNTISARVGYYNYYIYNRETVPWYWYWFMQIIDITFYPVDGPNHCHEAYHNDPGEIFDNRATNFFIAIAATLIIIPSCVLIALVLYLLSALRIVKRKKIERDKNLEKRVDSCNFLLNSMLHEIDHHGLDFPLDNAREKYIKLAEKIEILDGHLN